MLEDKLSGKLCSLEMKAQTPEIIHAHPADHQQHFSIHNADTLVPYLMPLSAFPALYL